MEHNFIGLQFTCEECPLVAVINDDLAHLSAISIYSSRAEMQALYDTTRSHMVNIAETEAVARRIGCKDVPKDLPPTPQPMPPLGSPERIEYGRHCLAYVALRKLRGQPEI